MEILDSAFICQQRALQLSLSTDSFLLHSLYGNIGDLCGRTGRNSIAIICLKRAYDACRLREDSLQCLWNLGEFYYNNGQLDSALYYLNRSKEAVDIHIRYLSFFDLYAIAKQQGNVEESFGISGNQHPVGRFYLFTNVLRNWRRRPIVGMPMRK